MQKDPTAVIAEGRMGLFQIVAVAICVFLNALDGFDVLAISFASPGISEEWGIDRGALLGAILSMELLGMAIGSVVLGRVADGIGRRPMMLMCLVAMGGGMALVNFAQGPIDLSIYRVITGLGIGGMLAATNAMVAEYSNNKNRALAVTIMAAGYPLGAVFGGMIVNQLVADLSEWREIFIFGAAVTLAMLPIVYFFLPESVAHLNRKRPAGVLERINKTLKKMGHEPVEELAAKPEETKSQGFMALFKDGMAVRTSLLTIGYFGHIMTFYFIIKWIPKLVVDMGYEGSQAADVLVWANVGGATGAILLGILTRRFNLWWLTFGAFAGGIVMVSVFGQGQPNLQSLAFVAASAGFFVNAGIVALYALLAQLFPPKNRAGGTGFVIGMGRGGAWLSPILGGALFQAGLSLEIVAVVMAMGSLIGIVALAALYVHMKKNDAEAAAAA